MFGEISYLRNCILVALLILSVLAIRCLSETTTRTDRISLNGSLSDGQTLVSMSKKFMLGFFRPGASSYRYVGIWYNNVPKRTVVWVANRNSPVRDSLGILKFDNSGNLIIVDGRGSSFTVAHGVRVEDVEAVILDSGNFVLRSIASHSKIIWQSFDFPTDTWLPGMNITVGTSRERTLLTSWKSYDDPTMGDYSFGPGVVNASQLIIWWKGNIFWTSARWNGDIYSLIPDLTSIGIIPVSFQCDNLTCTYTPNPSDRMTKIVLDPTGSLSITQSDPKAQSWTLLWRQPSSCDVSNICGVFGICNNSMSPFFFTGNSMSSSSLCQCPKGFAPQDSANTRKGCTRQIPLQCNGDRFIDMPGMQFPDNREKMYVMGNSECELACMINCSCTAYAHSLSDGCSLWHGNLTNLQDGYSGSGVGTLHLRVAASELESSSSSGHKMLWIAGVLPSVAFLIFCFISFIWIKRWKNKGKGKQHDHPPRDDFGYNQTLGG